MTAILDASFKPFPNRRLLRGLLRAGIAAGLGLLADVRVEGSENLPKEGPLLVVGNHFNFLDPLVLIHVLPYSLEFIAGRQAPNAPVAFGWLRNLWGILAVSRGGSSRDALMRAQRVLEQQGVLAIFPEGGSWATVLRPARAGAALLAARSAAPVLPVGLDGLSEVFAQGRQFGRRACVTVRIGKPFGPFIPKDGSRPSREELDDFGHELMRRIADLIPAERRGFYSDDPAVRLAALGTETYPWDTVIEK